jgi:DNA helicase II / ATP-dependent DNA helicase PcrA
MPKLATNPAKEAAEAARIRIQSCIDEGQSFLVEAGAGAGKTYSLVDALRYLVEKRGSELLRRHQRIACISYTNVAADEVETRTDRHPTIQSSTIHAFCWSVIRDFQPFLRKELPSLLNWPERLAEVGGIGERSIDYDLGHPKVEDKTVLLHHNDILVLTAKLLGQNKFRNILTSRFPIVFIDEYQDTDKDFTEALKSHLLSGNNPLVGFFGDHWQKIYGTGCGKMEHPNLKVIEKNANFRSVPVIVECLNHMRPELPQKVEDPTAKGSVVVCHTNDWPGVRRTGQHWDGDLPVEAAHAHLDALRKRLADEGWDFSPQETKILMLTHRALAAEQGYDAFEDVFEYNDSYIKKEDPHIAFFCDTLEPICAAYEKKQFGEMFAVLGDRVPAIRRRPDKLKWTQDMDKLLALRSKGTIGVVIDHLRHTKHPRLSEAIGRKEKELERFGPNPTDEEPPSITRLRRLRQISYQEIIALDRFIDEETPFATKHGVKGAEFENVLVVFGRGWNQYNFNQFLEWACDPDHIPENRRDAYERNRNLFYVTCSRPRRRLALLFTQKLTTAAMATLSNWFGGGTIQSLQISNQG